jgi:predicted 2-oxoglutarate/Fe(II)-dependent dioxygenase YbiX
VDLLRALHYIPFAITQATVYFNRRSRTTVASYLHELWRNNKKRQSLLSWDKKAEKLTRQALEEWEKDWVNAIPTR